MNLFGDFSPVCAVAWFKTKTKPTLKTRGYWGQGLSPLLVSGGWGKISNVVIDFAP